MTALLLCFSWNFTGRTQLVHIPISDKHPIKAFHLPHYGGTNNNRPACMSKDSNRVHTIPTQRMDIVQAWKPFTGRPGCCIILQGLLYHHTGEITCLQRLRVLQQLGWLSFFIQAFSNSTKACPSSTDWFVHQLLHRVETGQHILHPTLNHNTCKIEIELFLRKATPLAAASYLTVSKEAGKYTCSNGMRALGKGSHNFVDKY